VLRRRAALLLCVCSGALAAAWPAPRRVWAAEEPVAADEDRERDESAAEEAEGEDDDEEDDLRQHLTEREDQRRPVKPWSTRIGGRPLTISGEYELELGYVSKHFMDEPGEPPERLLLEHGLEIEAFYSFGEPLSIFVQVRLKMEDDLLHGRFEEISTSYAERGEMWLDSENLFGSGVSLDVGRLDFEDERRWWWDQELDAVRLSYEGEHLEVGVALARELTPERTDESGIDPEHEDVLRVLGEASWDWRPSHTLELFLLYQDDRSSGEAPGAVVHEDDEDESDARLTWLGARAIGVHPLRVGGLLGYWLDAAVVSGEEERLELEELTSRRSVVEGSRRRDVRGWAFDAGAAWILPFPFEPRLFAGYAMGSGDPDPESGRDRSFRQTGIEANEAGFGGVERFPHYGVLLDPELSNLQVATLGVGVTLLRSSSLDLVYHHYRLVERADALPDAHFEAELDDRHRDLGQELDLVLALEEWERLEFALIGSAFRPGRAFVDPRGGWIFGGFFAVRVAF